MKVEQWVCTMLVFCLACTKEKATIPTYISIHDARVVPYQSNGSVSQEVSDVWAYQYPEAIGTFELPTTLPIIRKDEERLILRGGVWENNIPFSRIEYPFWLPDTFYFQFQADKHLTYQPTFKYVPDTVLTLALNETFENQSIDFQLFNSSLSIDTTSILRTNNSVFEGNYAGYVAFDDTNSLFEITNITGFSLPRSNTPIWLEMAYQTTINFKVGLVIRYLNDLQVQAFELPINKDSQWHHLYINLTPVVYKAQPGSTFQFYLFANGQRQNHFLALDNIRILYFK